MIITFISVYLCFFICETVLHVSGILGIVTLGVMLGTYGKVRMSENTVHSIHVIWEFLCWTLETLLFLISGSYIGDNMAHSSETTLSMDDIYKSFLFCILLILIRFIVTISLSPCMNCTGNVFVSFKWVLVITYGGLRGAIALALAMIVMVDNSILDTRFKDLCLVYTIAVVLFTCCVNALTIKWLMKKINFLHTFQIML